MSKPNNGALVLPSPDTIIQLCEYVISANRLFLESNKLLVSVLESAAAGDRASKLLKMVISSSTQVDDVEALPAGGLIANMHETALRSAQDAAQQTSLAALGIRRTIGWIDHPYSPEQRNGRNTLIGIERELSRLYAQAALAAELSENEGVLVNAIAQRIQAVVRAANQNTLLATANAKAVETVEALSIKTARALENARLFR